MKKSTIAIIFGVVTVISFVLGVLAQDQYEIKRKQMLNDGVEEEEDDEYDYDYDDEDYESED